MVYGALNVTDTIVRPRAIEKWCASAGAVAESPAASQASTRQVAQRPCAPEYLEIGDMACHWTMVSKLVSRRHRE
jgi:hypothetical protein